MNEKILEKYQQYLRREYRKKRTAYNYFIFTKLFLQWIDKLSDTLTREDMLKWKEYILHTFKPNGNLGRVISLNKFLKWLDRGDLKLPIPKQEQSSKIVLSEKELKDYQDASKDDPLHHLITLFQIDGLLCPSEFSGLKLSNMDLDKSKALP